MKKAAKKDDDKRTYILLKKIRIKELKGLKDCTITLDTNKRLTAIMGVNGAGKSTIIHALACCFAPDDRIKERHALGERRRFSCFFPPSTDATWQNSEFSLVYDQLTGDGVCKKSDEEKIYKKSFDRWTPRYDRQPIRDTMYLGISTCLPEIETFNKPRANYTSKDREDKKDKAIVEQASWILNKKYEKLTINKIDEKHSLTGVKTEAINYSSLSMGAGEQRVFKILETINRAYDYSLILIDEIDLLMHSEALKRLVKKLYEIATEKNLQIIFTTHSLVMDELKDIVDIKYIDSIPEKTIIYDGITTLAKRKLTGKVCRPIKIYVEDEFAKRIAETVALDLSMKQKVEITTYGAAKNAFSLAASMIIKNEDIDNTLILLDGDVYRSADDKKKQIENVFSGTETDADEKRAKAVALISEFKLPEGIRPEKFLHDLICQSEDEGEIIESAKGIVAVNDSHDWVNQIADEIDDCSDIIMDRIVQAASHVAGWKEYVYPVIEWLEQRRDI